MVKVYVNEVSVEVEEGATILNALRKAGFKVPLLCMLTPIYREAVCRMCLVEIAGGRLVPACAYPVSNDLKIYTDTPRVRQTRRVTLELILASHRIQCWSCNRKGGDCILQNLAAEYGVEGIPVCSECPLYGDDCLLSRGEPCLGPLTVAGCNALCPRDGSPCLGCRGPITRKDVVRAALEYYQSLHIDVRKILSLATLFWSSTREAENVFTMLSINTQSS